MSIPDGTLVTSCFSCIMSIPNGTIAGFSCTMSIPDGSIAACCCCLMLLASTVWQLVLMNCSCSQLATLSSFCRPSLVHRAAAAKRDIERLGAHPPRRHKESTASNPVAHRNLDERCLIPEQITLHLRTSDVVLPTESSLLPCTTP